MRTLLTALLLLLAGCGPSPGDTYSRGFGSFRVVDVGPCARVRADAPATAEQERERSNLLRSHGVGAGGAPKVRDLTFVESPRPSECVAFVPSPVPSTVFIAGREFFEARYERD